MFCVSFGLWSPFLKSSPESIPVSPLGPGVMDGSVYRASFPLAQPPPLIGLKTARLGFGRRGHRPRLCLNHFNASTLARPIGSLIKTGPRQDSHRAHRKDLACSMLCLTLALSLFFFCIFKEHWRDEGRHIAHWHGYWHNYRFSHSCYHGNLWHMFANLIHWARNPGWQIVPLEKYHVTCWLFVSVYYSCQTEISYSS